MLCDAGIGAGRCRSGWGKKTKPSALSGSGCTIIYQLTNTMRVITDYPLRSTRIRIHDATNVHNYSVTACHQPVTAAMLPCSLFVRQTARLTSRLACRSAMPSPPAPRHVASSGLAVLRRACEGASLRLRVVRAAASLVAGIRSGSPAGGRTYIVRLLERTPQPS